MNFKVKCVGYVEPVTERGFTIGKVYDVVNGVITRDDGLKYCTWSDPACNPKYENTFKGLVNWFRNWYKFELVINDKIVITHDGKTTTATLYREDGSKEVATAKCSPEDTFDFNVGAKLAMERLMKKVEPVPVKKEKYTVGDRIFAEDNINHHPGGAWGTVGEVLDKRIHAEDYLVKFDDGSRLCSHVVPVPTTPEPIDLASKFKTGDYAKIIAKKWGHNFKIGTIVKLEKCEYNYRATADGKSWKVLDDELEAYTPPKYFTGKVVCIENTLDDGDFTIGKIYEIKDGNFTDNRGYIRPKTGGRDRVKTLSDLENEYYSNWYYKFIPIVE